LTILISTLNTYLSTIQSPIKPLLLHHSFSNLMETLKRINNNNKSSLGASIGLAFSGAAGTDGAHTNHPNIHAAEYATPINEKTQSSTTLDRKLGWWP